MAWLDDALANLGIRGFNIPGVVGMGQAAQTPSVAYSPITPTPSLAPRPGPSLIQAVTPGGMIPSPGPGGKFGMAQSPPAPGFDPPQPDAISWNKTGQMYRQGAVAAGGGSPSKTPYGDWSSGVGGNVSGFMRGLFGLAPSDNASAPAAPVPPTKPVAATPVAQTPSGPAPVAPTAVPAAMPSPAAAYPDRRAFEQAMGTQFPGQYRGPDGITLGMPPAAAPAASQGPQTFEQVMMHHLLTTPYPDERFRAAQVLAGLHTPQAEATRRLQAIYEKTYNDTRASLEAQRNSGVLKDEDFEQRHQAAMKEYTKRLKEIAVPGTIPYDQD